MVDEIANVSVTPEAPVVSPSPESAPAVAEPVVAPFTETPIESPAVENAVETPAPDTLLGAEKNPESKPAEKPLEEAKPEADGEIVKEEPVAEVTLPVYEAFTLPEGLEFEAEKMGEFTKELAEFELKTKAPHEETQALGQRLIDRHIEELNRYTKSLTTAWEKQANEWKDSVIADPEIGGNRRETVLKNAGQAINQFGGSPEQIDQFFSMIESTKVGNHPAQIRLINNMMNEITRLRTAYESEEDVRPLAAPQIASKVKGTKIERMYGAKK